MESLIDSLIELKRAVRYESIFGMFLHEKLTMGKNNSSRETIVVVELLHRTKFSSLNCDPQF